MVEISGVSGTIGGLFSSDINGYLTINGLFPNGQGELYSFSVETGNIAFSNETNSQSFSLEFLRRNFPTAGVVNVLIRDVSNNLNDLSGNVLTNKNNIATNTANIATNTANIATNTANIATNTANIATNTANIATNTANIATNTNRSVMNEISITLLGERIYDVSTNLNALIIGDVSTNTFKINDISSNLNDVSSNVLINKNNISSNLTIINDLSTNFWDLSAVVDVLETNSWIGTATSGLDMSGYDISNIDNLFASQGYNTYQTLGIKKIVNPPSNTLTVGGVNISALNKRTRTSNASAVDCVSNWTTRKANNLSWGYVCWSSELSLFCAVGINSVMTSPDGINWTTRTSASNNNWQSVLYP